MATATNGEVWYERSVKVADYENKKFGARISYVIDAGDDAEAVYDLFSRQVVRKVEEALGLRPQTANAGSTTTYKLDPAQTIPTKLSVAPAAAVEPAPQPKAAAAAQAEVPADTPKPKGKPGRPKGSGKKAEPKDEVPADEPEVREAKFEEMVRNTPDPEPGDEIDHPGFSGKPKKAEPITDADLGKAARAKAEKVGSAVKVKEFIQAFFDTPCPNGAWRTLDVPQDRRAEFIKQLETLE